MAKDNKVVSAAQGAPETAAENGILTEGLTSAVVESTTEASKKPVVREWTDADQKAFELTRPLLLARAKQVIPDADAKFIEAFVDAIPDYFKGATVGQYKVKMDAFRKAPNWDATLKALNALKEFNIATSPTITRFNNFVSFVTPRGEGKPKTPKDELLTFTVDGTVVIIKKSVFDLLKVTHTGDVAAFKAAVLAANEAAASKSIEDLL
jgi:hypothetical protein